MADIGTFPFGQPIHSVSQKDRSEKDVFVLGVYASAVHARWDPPARMRGIRAVAVASEPEIFWRGENVSGGHLAVIDHSLPLPCDRDGVAIGPSRCNRFAFRLIEEYLQSS